MVSQLRPSLISSFNLNHSIASPQLPTDAVTQSNHYWPRSLPCNPAVDVYLLMENDADKWRGQLNVDRGGRSALDFFSALNLDHCQVMARQLVANASLIAGAPIVALTSFFPEISLERDDSTHFKVVSVLQSLFLVAAEVFRCQQASASETTGATTMPACSLAV